MNYRVRVARQGLLIGLLLPIIPAPSASAGKTDSQISFDAKVYMSDLAGQFKKLETSLKLGSGNWEMEAEQLSKKMKTISQLKLNKNPTELTQFDSYQKRILKLGQELQLNGKQKKTETVKEVFAKIRNTCISCHVRFREPLDRQGYFPAKANILTGKIEVQTLEGEDKADKSDILIFLDPGPKGSYSPSFRATISQQDRNFTPAVLSILKGTTVEFPNNDLIFHNVFSLSETKPFDLGIYPAGQSKTVTFNRAGMVKVFCNIHPKMVNHIAVLNNPYFTLTEKDGFYVITDIPDGEYQVRLWHRFGNEEKKTVKFHGKDLFELNIGVREIRRFVQHKNKLGKEYKEKY